MIPRSPSLQLLLSSGLAALTVGLLLPVVAMVSVILLHGNSPLFMDAAEDAQAILHLAIFGFMMAAPVATIFGPPILVTAFRNSPHPLTTATIVGGLVGAVAWLEIPILLGVGTESDYAAFSFCQGGFLGAASAHVGARYYGRTRNAA